MSGFRADIAEDSARAHDIEEILATLPLRRDVPRQKLVLRRRRAAELLSMLYRRESDSSAISRNTTRAGAKREIKELVQLSRKLRDHIRDMHGNTWGALEASPNRVSLLALLQPLEWTIDSAPLADLDGLPKSVGRPVKAKCRRIAEALAWEYRALTGEPPSRTSRDRREHPFSQEETGLFTRVVQAVFGRLNLDAQAQSFAVDAIKAVSERGPPDLWPLEALP